MTDNRNLLELTAAEKQDLERWAQSRTLPAGDVFRARLILALADGQSYREMVRGMRTSAATIARWRRRFEQDRLAGLEGRHRGSKPRTATPAVQARVVRRVQQQPSDGSTHWSCRKLAGELGVSKSTVQRILMQARLKPHRLERYLASDDPDFEAKAADIIGLYLEPPQHAAVFCVDEKTAIQALDRLDPVLPLSPGRAERHGFEYYRHGTLSLRGVEHEYGEGGGQDRVAPHQRRVRRISHPNPRAPTASSRDPRDRRQPLRAQDQTRAAVPGGQPAGAPPLHPHLLLLVESDRALVLPDRTRRDCTRGLYFEARSQPETPTVHPQVQRRRDPDQVGLPQPAPSDSTWYQVTRYRPLAGQREPPREPLARGFEPHEV